MSLYRDHRGGFSESMRTVREIHSLEELAAHLQCPVDAITVEPYPYWQYPAGHAPIRNTGQLVDKRNGWHTHIVCVRGNAVGWTNEPIK